MLDIKQTLLDILSDKHNTTERERIDAYNELVEKSVIETDNTTTLQSTKNVSTRVYVNTNGVSFGYGSLIFESSFSLSDDTPLIVRYISNRDKIRAFIVELKMAEREMKKQIDSYYEENSTPLKK
tara:strand:+ start:1981 stop:2355 length:375 start_codon:yes stop_codon:yes gene_type:complete